MNPVVINLLACLAAYLLGSISFAVLSARIFKMADPRTYGSGNPGATNVLRTGNKKAAIFTLLGDALKGVLAVLLARYFGLSDVGIALVALAVFLGHIYPIFLKFKGGKGVATACGVLLALAPPIGLACLLTWLVVLFTTRYSSLAAILAGISAPAWAVLVYGFGEDAAITLVMGIILVVKHRLNIERLIAGTETKVGGQKTGDRGQKTAKGKKRP
jgi:glycerol-3-phosphate acyltransferase PlsY